MATPNATPSSDGTSVTIRFTAELAQHAARAVRWAMHSQLEDLQHEWDEPGPYTSDQLERYVAAIQAIGDRYVPLLRQFEVQEVIDYGTARYYAYQQAAEREPDVELAPPTTGDVIITCDVAEWEGLLTYLDAADAEDAAIVAAIREQLEAARS